MKASACYILLCILLFVSCRHGDEQKNGISDRYRYATLIPDSFPLKSADGYKRVAVDASVYVGLMQMLGVEDRCIDFSTDMQPDVERLASVHPDLILLSAYDGADFAKYRKLGVPIVECRDFLEPSALARAEWMRFLGRLFGVEERADSLFRIVENEYLSLASTQKTERKSVFFDLVYNGIWYQPSPESTIGQVVADAGGVVPFHSEQQGGSLSLSEEQVLVQAENADCWIIRTIGAESLDRKELARLRPSYSRFKAFKTGNVFVCDTRKTRYYEETAFRPDWLLCEMKSILNGNTDSLRYFHRIN